MGMSARLEQHLAALPGLLAASHAHTPFGDDSGGTISGSTIPCHQRNILLLTFVTVFPKLKARYGQAGDRAERSNLAHRGERVRGEEAVHSIVILVIFLVIVLLVVRGQFWSRAPSGTLQSPSGASATVPKAPPPRNVEDALADLATCVRPKETGNLSTVVQVRIEDHIPADWHFQLGNGECTLLQGMATDAPLTVGASAETWIDLAAKRISFTSAYMKGNLRVQGDNVILLRLDDEFSGPVDASRR